MSVEEALKRRASHAALGRMVSVEEVANVAVFLASDLSTGMTGQTINVNAGGHMD